MTQNLDLDLDKNKTLTPADTNISEDWKPEYTTMTVEDELSYGTWVSNNTPRSYNPGDVYYYTSNSNADDIRYNSSAECEAAEHTDCSHYHAGNYYNWTAAIASNDSSVYTEQYFNANTSICPAGWRLPKNANANSYTEYNEQNNMISIYDGILNEQSSYGIYNYLEGGFAKIRTAPLWLTRSGSIYYGSIGAVGINGVYRSSTVGSDGWAFTLYFGLDEVRPAYNSDSHVGYSVRCLAE